MSPKYFLQLLALSALWGASFPLLRIASPLLGPSVLTALRVAVAALAFAFIMRWTRQAWPWRHWRELTLLGLVSIAGPFYLFAWASLTLPGGYIALLNTTAVVFGTLFSSWLKEDRLTLGKLLGCLSGFLGVALIVQLGPVQPTAAVLLATAASVAAAACFGLSSPLMKRATRHIETLAIAGPMNAISLLFLLPGGLWNLPQANFTPMAVLVVLLLGVGSSSLAFWAHLRIMRHMTPVAAMSPMFFIPLFGVTWGHLLLGEALGPGIYLGGMLVLLAAALVTGFNPFRRSVAAPADGPRP